jgi:hypothetical protein
MVARQLIRERLVNVHINNNHALSMEVSSWVNLGSGYISALKNEYVWGPASTELLSLSFARKYVVVFRLVEVAGLFLLLLIVSLLSYDLLQSQ